MTVGRLSVLKYGAQYWLLCVEFVCTRACEWGVGVGGGGEGSSAVDWLSLSFAIVMVYRTSMNPSIKLASMCS